MSADLYCPLDVKITNPADIGANVKLTREVEAPHVVANTWGPLPSLGTVLDAQNNPQEILQLDLMRKRTIVTVNGSGQCILAHSKTQAQSLQQNVQQAADEGCLFTAPTSFVYEATAPLWAVGVPAFQPQNTVGSAGKVTAPGAGAVITSISSANWILGTTYAVNVTVYLDGTVVAATDEDNMALRFGGTTIAPLIYPGVANTPVTTGPYYIQAVSLNTINVIAVGAASASAVYHASLTATPFPFNPTTGVITVGTLAERRDS